METAITYVVLALVLLALLVAMVFRTRPTPKGTVITDPVIAVKSSTGIPIASRNRREELSI
jgi:hypothetical protein